MTHRELSSAWHLVILLVAGVTIIAATPPTARGDDQADVRASCKSFADALMKGDAATAKSLVVSEDGTDKLLEGMASALAGQIKYIEAAKAKFGEQGASADIGSGLSGLNWVKALGDSDVKVDGDTAKLTPHQMSATRPGRPARNVAPQALQLKKADGKWKLEVADMGGLADPEKAGLMLSILANAYTDTAAEISGGKVGSVSEARLALLGKIGAFFAPVTRPSGSPPR